MAEDIFIEIARLLSLLPNDARNVLLAIVILYFAVGLIWATYYISCYISEYKLRIYNAAVEKDCNDKIADIKRECNDKLYDNINFYNEKHAELAAERMRLDEQYHKIQDLRNVFEEKQQTYPWLANFIAEYYYVKDNKAIDYLQTKKNPAFRASKIVDKYSKENRALRLSLKQTEHQLAVYESTFPWLLDFKEATPDEVVASLSKLSETEEPESEYETLKHWLSPEEYNQLSNVEKYQLALDRYEKRNKSNWEIGREYERYIGFLYENKGYAVSYVGALMGLEDLGRDLIAKKNNKILIIQCKNWAERKTIHEKHIFQLFGSVTEYNIEKDTKAKGVFVSTCDLSEKAQAFARELKIKCSQVEFNQDYPKIKCNISERTGEKIYHLPFDQQYDRVIIESEKGECYVSTVAEAEYKGFRRAKRYIPESLLN